MKTRPLGKTSYHVSEVGMGCEGFINKSVDELNIMFDCMQSEGINCIDLYTPDPEMRSNLGIVLKGRREHFVLQAHLCSVWKEGQYKRTRDLQEVKQGFEDLLQRLDTDFVDIGMIHYVDAMQDWQTVSQGPVMAYAQELKAAGKIRSIGLSSHNPKVAIEAVQSGLIEVLMFSINPCYDLMPSNEDLSPLFDAQNYQVKRINMDPEREKLYECCAQRGVGITVMKAFGGGDLLDGELAEAGVTMTPYQCIQYALDRPGVASVLVGARTLEELKESAAFQFADVEQRDYASALAHFSSVQWQGHCMYCGHCAPCPKAIDIASVTKFLNLAKAQKEVVETVREHYAVLSHHGSECIGCGACETRCPFQVKIMENMQEAKTIFGY